MDVKELFKQAKEKYSLAQKAVEEGDLELAQSLETEGDELSQKAETLKKIQEKNAKLAEPVMPAPLPQDNQLELPETNNDNSVARAIYNIRYSQPDSAVKAVLTDMYGNDYEDKRYKQWKAFNRYLRRYDRQPSYEDEQLLNEIILTPEYAQKAITEGWDVDNLKSTMVEAVDTLGGYVVPVDFQARVIERLMGMVVMRGRAFQMTTSRDRVEMPVATGGDGQYTSAVRVTWVDETPTAGDSETNLTFGLEAIPVHTVMAETPLSRNLVEDSAVNLADYLARKFAEAAAIDEDNQFLTGDGTGKPQGILPSSANGLSLTEENSGNASALTFDGLIGLTYAIDAQYRQNAVWIGEKATYEAMAKLKDANGQYLWRDQFGNNASEGSRPGVPLLRYPTLEQEAMPTIAANAYPLIFGDPNGYTIVDRIGMSVERYLDSQTARQNLVYYVMRRRLGGQVTEPWRFAVQKVSA